MTVLDRGMRDLFALLQATWPGGATLLHPDDGTPFETALQAADDAGNLLVRYYQPQLLETGGLAEMLCTVDVCARTSASAIVGADTLLAAIGSLHARAPTGAIQPRAASLREASYHRVNVQFTLLVDTL
jgi:hypothetical protein